MLLSMSLIWFQRMLNRTNLRELKNTMIIYTKKKVISLCILKVKKTAFLESKMIMRKLKKLKNAKVQKTRIKDSIFITQFHGYKKNATILMKMIRLKVSRRNSY